jgi:tetratricopeptide (TPR) repeat protein
VLIVMGGNFPADEIRMTQKCSAAAKAVVLVNPGETATIASQPANSGHALVLAGDYLVVDGLGVNSPGTPYGEYDAEIAGSHNALLNVGFRPPAIPSFKFGVVILGRSNLIYRSYLHDYGSPDATQNPDGGGGFVLAVLGAAENVIWSNHLTRGGHDESLCKSGCRNNRWLNNVMDGGWGQGWIAVNGSDHNLVEGNFIQGVGQIAPFYKPAIQVSGANNTVRRNVAVNSKTWALEISAFGGKASYNLVYNNVFYNSGGCYFQSSNGGMQAYNNVIFANNICYKVQDVAFRIYLGNTTNRNTGNTILSVDAAGKPQPERAFIMWNQLGGGTYETLKSIAVADRSYNPSFSRNRAVSVVPRFVDEAKLDFHLSAGSPLLDAGIAIADAEWGSTVGPVDLGAFGIAASNAVSGPADPGMEQAQAGDYEAAAKAVRERANMPHALPMEAALLRAAFDDAGAAAVLARIGSPSAGDLVARYERVRQGTTDPALWDLLAANPERLLEMADTYIQWGLVRDVLVLVTHKYPQPVPALNNALILYYRSYCRDRLDYAYYAGEDLRVAATLPVKDLSPRFPGGLQVFQLIAQRNPTDANARLLLALLYQNAGRVSAAREALQNALKLRPGFPDAEALLAKLVPEPAAARKIRPVGSDPAPDAAATAAVAALTSPREIAAMALRMAASGDIGGAMSYFTPARFPQEKQEDAVREAYIELRLRRVVALAAAKQCAAAIQGLTNLEAEDKSLPFTSHGFGSFTRGIRVQYLVGVVEFACVDQNAARKRWEVLAKATPEIASTDHAYPYMALAKLDPAEGKIQARRALGFLQRQLGTALPEYHGALLYSQGLLQTIIGSNDAAAASFQAGAAAGPPGMVEYLNLEAIRTLGADQ